MEKTVFQGKECFVAYKGLSKDLMNFQCNFKYEVNHYIKGGFPLKQIYSISCLEGKIKIRLNPCYYNVAYAIKNLPSERLSFNELGEYLSPYILRDEPKSESCCYTGRDFLLFLNPKLI